MRARFQTLLQELPFLISGSIPGMVGYIVPGNISELYITVKQLHASRISRCLHLEVLVGRKVNNTQLVLIK